MSGRLQIIYGCDFSNWVKEKIPRARFPLGTGTSIGIGDDQRLLAAAVFTDYTGRALQCHLASDSPAWCSHRTLKALFAYPFEDLSCVRISALVASDNLKSKSLVERLGFVHEGTLREFYERDVHLLAYGMLKRECRYI